MSMKVLSGMLTWPLILSPSIVKYTLPLSSGVSSTRALRSSPVRTSGSVAVPSLTASERLEASDRAFALFIGDLHLGQFSRSRRRVFLDDAVDRPIHEVTADRQGENQQDDRTLAMTQP